MIDYQKYNLDSFKLFVENILSKKFKGKFNYSDIKGRVETILLGETSRLTAKSFRNVISTLDEDFDKFCKLFFKNHPASKLKSLENNTNKLEILFNPLLNSKAQLSKASCIKETRLGELFKNRFNELYAYEAYGLAIAVGLKPSQLFNYFYGDGERPLVGIEV
ncbi:hypothetical protein FAZ19_01215 [Sphingobacterium alkalisoli]|uniref:Uncharacterized protein n=1 Tax=Sphingobacterium alkalisoli TaxID=1874115 RepID=A0A4U0HBF9_9SPHI|nr:hypothetical protein [Sphingobacterium alkalisoli]TJY67912.1 hypothetical protein FAZ19_01215 [Sphingobacterium alkalisoli]GGH10450.1 hypothetical protein GCM10011418_08850 [Sphingobacterium alkalisoli]